MISRERLDGTMGQPQNSVISDWEELETLPFPDAKVPDRFAEASEKMKTYGDEKYYIASLCLSGFTVMTFLRGFENAVCDLYEETEMMRKLAEKVFGFEEQVIR